MAADDEGPPREPMTIVDAVSLFALILCCWAAISMLAGVVYQLFFNIMESIQ